MTRWLGWRIPTGGTWGSEVWSGGFSKPRLVRGGRSEYLTLGVGPGGGMASLSEAFPGSLVVGADLIPAAVHYSAQRNVGKVLHGSVNCLPFKDQTFDVVLILDVLNVAQVDEAMALNEAHRLLRPGALLVVNVPAFQSLRGVHDVAVHTCRRYHRSDLQQLLVQHGFTVLKLVYWNALLFPVAFAVRRLRSGNGRGTVPRSDLMPLPKRLNQLLTWVIAFDTRLCSHLPMPFGTSIFSVAAKLSEALP